MPYSHWSMDLGTTNTLLARWNGTHAETVTLDDICELEPVWRTPLIPSLVCFDEPNHGFVGTQARAAEETLRSTFAGSLTPFARSFKRTLARESHRAVAEVANCQVSARDCASLFVREVIGRASERERKAIVEQIPSWNFVRRTLSWLRREGAIRHLVMTVPVESFEPYRMELNRIARNVGIPHFTTLDEPVAAALGYGVDLTEDRNLLVVDFGGGTLDIAAVRTRLDGKTQHGGISHSKAESLAARGLDLGGETVDEWVTDLACSRLPGHSEALRPILRVQAEAVKKELSGRVLSTDASVFRIPGGEQIVISRAEFNAELEKRQLYADIQRTTQAVLEDCRHRITAPDIDAVLLTGGSTLLPGIRELFEAEFGAARVHYWEPFEAVVKGAATYGAGYTVDQIIHHDYAIQVWNAEAEKAEYELLIRRGTPYPTTTGFQTRYYKVGKNSASFMLPICEVGYAGRVSLPWNRKASGHDYWLPTGTQESECVVSLNSGDALRIAPPGDGETTRLRVDFTIDGERYLCATVHDTLRHRDLKTDDRVVRLR